MARQGRFGRLPRTAPNLSATIVAMVREINAQEDTNLLNAWENGGEVDGKPVTDERLLRHFRDRRDAISKTDPLWDKWDQALTNYTFSIAESKMTLKYAQHKVGEGEMAAFYRKWAGKVPTDSEAYRELMRSASQFVDAAKGRASSASAGASQSAYNAAIQSSFNKYEKDWAVAESLLTTAAYRAGILQQTDTTTPDDLMDLRGGDEADHARFLDLFDQIQNDPYYADIKQAMRQHGLDGLTYGQFVALGGDKAKGIDNRIRIARQFGDESGASDFAAEKVEFTMLRAKVADINEFAAYQDLRRTTEAQLAQGVLNPYQVRDLLTGYRSNIESLRNSALAEEDRGFFNNELSALSGEGTIGPTAFEGVEGGIRTATSADSVTMAGILNLAEQTIRSVESGQAVMTLGMDANGVETYGTISVNDPSLRDPRNGTQVFIAGGQGHPTMNVYAQFRPITMQAAVTDPRTGRPVSQAQVAGDAVLGVTYRVNGRDYYGIYMGNGGQDIRWFSDNPFRSDASVVNSADGLTVTVPAAALSGASPAGVNPVEALDPRALNDDLYYRYRYDTAIEAVYDRDTAAREALLRTSDAQLQQQALLSPDPEATLSTLYDLRNNIVDYHNQRAIEAMDSGLVWRAAREAARTGEPLRLSPEVQRDIQTFDQSGVEHERATQVARRMTGGSLSGFLERDTGAYDPATAAAAIDLAKRGAAYAPYLRPGVSPGLQAVEQVLANQPLGQYAAGNLGGTPTPAIKVPGVQSAADLQPERIGARPPSRPNVYQAPLVTPLPSPQRVDPITRRPIPDPRILERETDDRIRTPRIHTPHLPPTNFGFRERRGYTPNSGFLPG